LPLLKFQPSYNFNQQVHTTVIRFTIVSLKTLNSYTFRTSYLVTMNYTSNSSYCGHGYSPPDI